MVWSPHERRLFRKLNTPEKIQAYIDGLIYKTATGWGSIAKSNTTLLAGRHPFYKNVRELVMSYFDFYFNTKRKLCLQRPRNF